MSKLLHLFKAFIVYLLVVFSSANSSLDKKTYLVFSAFTYGPISLLKTNLIGAIPLYCINTVL